MRNNYYNKRFLFEELDIEEQRDRIQQIITTCIETFEEIVESHINFLHLGMIQNK